MDTQEFLQLGYLTLYTKDARIKNRHTGEEIVLIGRLYHVLDYLLRSEINHSLFGLSFINPIDQLFHLRMILMEL